STLASPRQILRRNRLVGRLRVPEDCHNPPPRPIVVQLKTVDATRERLALRSALRIVSTEGVQHGAECLGRAVNLAFEETLPLPPRAGGGNVALGPPPPRCRGARRASRRRDQAGAGDQQRAESAPTARLTRRP